MNQRWLRLAGVILIAALIAFPLRQAIYDTIVVPVAFLLWGIGLLYRAWPQVIWWIVLVVLVVLMLLNSLLPQSKPAKLVPMKFKPPRGQVEDLVLSIQKAQKGIYFKWMVANRLGKLAYQILLHRESGRPRSVFAPLLGVDWEPKKELQNYLEIGLHGSFADYPNVKAPFGAPPKTPLDFDVSEAVEFLESQIENGRSG
ncbi:MAG TPA: hypothetical protein VK249_09315 [Anaerolineales bacterium]|nr:hypothetical protein [Anaerolineales bacterium]